MTAIWGIHSDHPELDLVGNNLVAIGWDEIGNLLSIGQDREAFKQALISRIPAAKPGAIPVWAGVLYRFVFEMQAGDVIIHPHKPDSTLSFGRIASDYYYDADAPYHRNRRKVDWLKTGVSRSTFTQSALYEVGSAVTLFSVKKHAAEFTDFLNGTRFEPEPRLEALAPEQAIASAEDEPDAERIERATSDFVIDTLLRAFSPTQFEEFVAQLLQCMGYRTQVTPPSGDGGVDIIAHHDPLGLEPPIIKVQCKRTADTISAPTVQSLTGTLAPRGQELGLFVTLGSYSRDAVQLGRTRQDLRLISGAELVQLVFEHYEQLQPQWKARLPMRAVYVVDRSAV